MSQYIGYFDGCCEPNPGSMGIGAVIMDGTRQVVSVSKSCGKGTNNEAEWLALIALLELVIERSISEIEICGDSQLVIKQITNEWRMKAENLRPLKAKAQRIANQIRSVTFRWIPREQNEMADRLSFQCIR